VIAAASGPGEVLASEAVVLIDRAVETHVRNEERLLSVLTSAERRTLDRVLKSLLIELERTKPRS
jgi:hypothetical protein